MSGFTSSIVPVRNKWTFTVVDERRSTRYSLTIYQDTTVRRLYWETRKTCGATSALELRTRAGVLLAKDDRRLIDAGITGPSELLLRILAQPDIFTIFVKLPDRQEQSTFEISETDSLAAFHEAIKTRINREHPPPRIHLRYAEESIASSDNVMIRDELFDGVSLVAEVSVFTLFLNLGSRNNTMNIPKTATMRELYQELRSIAPPVQSNQAWRLLSGEVELPEDSTTVQERNLSHCKTLLGVVRVVGGNEMM